MDGAKKPKIRKDRPRKRNFFGNRFTKAKQQRTDPACENGHVEDFSDNSSENTGSEEVFNRSASYFKLNGGLEKDLGSDNGVSESDRSTRGGEGLRLFERETIESFIQLFPCPACFLSSETKAKEKTFKVEEKLTGINSELSVVCSLCGYAMPCLKNEENINLRYQLAMYGIGCHEKKGRRFLASMNMPPPVSAVRAAVFKERIKEATKSVAQESMEKAADEVKLADGDRVTVGCDGSWQRRGFSSKNGVATCLSVNKDLGCKVIDTETLSNYCHSCAKAKARKESDEDLEKWKANHSAQCKKNHDGSAGSMEPVGIKRIFERSEELYGLTYTGYLGDGDSKSYKCVSEADPPIYKEVAIEKFECCGHVQKRMGKRLLDKVAQCKSKQYQHGKKKVKGIGGAGRLTKTAIKRIQGHYGGAIRKNVGDLAKMKKAVWAIYHHRKGEHKECGEWCDGSDRNRLPDFVLEEIKSVFEDLSDDRLLKKCLHGGTQNANEAFHHLVWDRCPKSVFVGRDRLQIAVHEATIVFNDGDLGRCKVFENLGLSVGKFQVEGVKAADRGRVKGAEQKAKTATKTTRAKRNVAAAEEDSGDEVYKAGAF